MKRYVVQPADRRAIAKRFRAGGVTQKRLAKDYGVTRRTIMKILRDHNVPANAIFCPHCGGEIPLGPNAAKANGEKAS